MITLKYASMLGVVLFRRQVRFMTNRLKLKDEEDKVVDDSISVNIFIRGRV